jgi:hypothetical protein
MRNPQSEIRDPQSKNNARRIRQPRTIVVLAALLVVGGLIVLFTLDRMPLPMRLLVGLTDVFAGLTLLILVRQKFSER